jgi:U32 family peptidase
MSIELLAPAGGPEPFRAALAAGADAIYCGVGNDFNARRNASNFDFDSFEAACRAAHLAGTRVYVTINVVVREEEMGRALALVREASVRGADAFIIQDWGLFERIHRIWPELELHVSTQANVHDARGTAWAREQGAHRVTLSRELSLPEISRIAEEGVELECFGHGALCFCYSGVCLMSSMAGGRSANRGLCAQPCRLLYKLVDEQGKNVAAPGRTRPLCPKDACTASDVDALIAAGVGSLKVEGRMKAPDYVWSVIGAYREQIDSALANPGAPELGATPVSAGVGRRLKRAFNRDFTDAYLRGTSGDELMSYERSNNRGQLVGEVLSSSGTQVQRKDGRGNLHADPRQDKRRARCTVTVRVSEPVGAGDLLELRPDNDPDSFLTAQVGEDVPAGGTVECKVARPMPVGCPVRVIRSKAAHDGSDAALAREVSRKRPVAVRVVARLGEPFRVELSCTTSADGSPELPQAAAEGFTVEPARTKPVTREDLIEHVGRMGTSAFEPVSFEVELDEGCGMGFSAVHKVRAAACEALEQAILASYAERAASLAPVPAAAELAPAPVPTQTPAAPEICVLATSPQVAAAAIAAGATRVYVPADELASGGPFAPAGTPGTPAAAWPAGTIPVADEVCREPDHARIDPWLASGMPVAVGNVSELALAAERGAAAELRGCIPVHNSSALAKLTEAGAAGVWLSPELTLAEIQQLAPLATIPVGLAVYGRVRVMTSEHCVLQAADKCIHDCSRCALRRRELSLCDKDGRELPVRTDANGRSRIYDAAPLDLTPQVGELVAAGVTRLAVDATLLSEQEAASAVARVKAALEAVQAGKRPAPREKGATSGHLFWGIG